MKLIFVLAIVALTAAPVRQYIHVKGIGSGTWDDGSNLAAIYFQKVTI